MTNIVFYGRDFPTTLSTTRKIGSYVSYVACAITLGSSIAVADTDGLNTRYENANAIVKTVKSKSIISSTGLKFLLSDVSEIPKFSLELVNKNIEKFMLSLENVEDISYGNDLVDLAQQVLQNNPDAFKNFI